MGSLTAKSAPNEIPRSAGPECEDQKQDSPQEARRDSELRYRMVFVNPEEGKIILLFDNHFPKGHHRHFPDGTEGPYNFQSVSKLVEDYRQAVLEEIYED